MKSHRQELWFHASKRRELFRITERAQSAIAESGVKEGLVLVNAMPITIRGDIFEDDSQVADVAHAHANAATFDVRQAQVILEGTQLLNSFSVGFLSVERQPSRTASERPPD